MTKTHDESDRHGDEATRAAKEDKSALVSSMLVLATLLVVALAYLVGMDVSGGIAALFLSVWAMYFTHPRTKVIISD